MAYSPGQLPYVGYRAYVRTIKKAHDKAGGGYPLRIEVHDSKQQLMEHTFKNVWDRAKPSIVAREDWTPPITVKVFRDGRVEEAEIEDVEVGSEQLGLAEFLGEED